MSSWLSFITYTLPLNIVLCLERLGVTGRVSKLGIFVVLGLGGVLGFGGAVLVTGCTCTSFSGCFSPGHSLGCLIDVDGAVEWVTHFPLATKPTTLSVLGCAGGISKGSSGMES